MGEIRFLVGFAPGGGRLALLHHDLIHNGFELTEFLTKKPHWGCAMDVDLVEVLRRW
jgi:hypothetical protein